MPVACAQCGSESTLDAVYAVETSALGRKRRYCPRCWREMHVRRAREALVVFTPLAVGAFVLLALGGPVVGTGVAWFFLNLCLVAFFLELATLPHELGHALTAYALGFRVFSITTGVGPRILQRTVRGVQFSLHAYPFGGFTVTLPHDRRLFRVKSLLVVAAGPAVNGLFVAGALVLGGTIDFGAMIDGPCVAAALLMANALLLVMNLLPMKAASAAGVTRNDGLVLLLVPFVKAAQVTEALAARYALEAETCRERNELLEARSWAERGLEEFPNTPLLQSNLGFTLVLLGDCEGARLQFQAAAEGHRTVPALRALALNNIAWVDAVTAPNERLDEADRMSQEALQALGFLPSLKGTRGTVLVALGRREEGIELLRAALREEQDEELHPMARASYAGALALALAEQGRVAEAAALLPAARGYHGRSPLLPRVEAALDAASRQAGENAPPGLGHFSGGD